MKHQQEQVSGWWPHFVLCSFHWHIQFCVFPPVGFPQHCHPLSLYTFPVEFSPSCPALFCYLFPSAGFGSYLFLVTVTCKITIPQISSVNSNIIILVPEYYSISDSMIVSYSLDSIDLCKVGCVGAKGRLPQIASCAILTCRLFWAEKGPNTQIETMSPTPPWANTHTWIKII